MVRLTINGEDVEVDAPDEMPLLWVLRDVLALTGTKYGCGIGQCGACTVHLESEAFRSCLTPVGSIAGRRVTTIEGLSADRSHPVQRAWIEEDVPQCGYCQSGQIMGAAAWLARRARDAEAPLPEGEAGDAIIDEAMRGHVCRCATYVRIRRAIRRAAGEGA